MTFDDLPKNWYSRPLTDPTLAVDVVDLVVREADRADGCVSLLLCDADGRMIQPVTITEIEEHEVGERGQLFDLVLAHLASDLGGLVVAIGRPRGPDPDDEARAWHEAAIASCREHRVPLLGTYLATATCVVEMPEWEGLRAVS